MFKAKLYHSVGPDECVYLPDKVKNDNFLSINGKIFWYVNCSSCTEEDFFWYVNCSSCTEEDCVYIYHEVLATKVDPIEVKPR